MKKLLFVYLAAVLILSGTFFSTQASPAAASSPKILDFDTMVGVPRPYTGPTNAIRDIPGGGLPWVVGSAKGKLETDGSVEIKVTGLVIDPNDPAAITAGVAGINPAPAFEAIVSCLSKDASGAPITVNRVTPTFPASPDGNSMISATVDLPHPCIAPIVFVASPGGAWFAATGN